MVKENGSYTEVTKGATIGIPNDDQNETFGIPRIGKDRKEEIHSVFPIGEEEKISSSEIAEEKKTEILPEKKQGRSEEKKFAVKFALHELKDYIVNQGIAYKGNKDRQFVAHILYAKEYGEHCERLNIDRMEYARKIVVASQKIPFLKGWVCGGPEDIYRRHAIVYNEFMKQKAVAKQKETPWVFVPTPPPDGLYSKE